MSSIYGNPPASAGIEYLSELRNQSQNEAVGPSASVPTNNKPRYERVYVLLASWADDSAYDEGLAEVGGAFEAALDGIVDKVAIPNKNASAVFNKNIMDVIHKAQSPGNHLVILYYQGGSKMLDGRFVLSK